MLVRILLAVFLGAVILACGRQGAWWLGGAVVVIAEYLWRRPEHVRRSLAPFAADALVGIGACIYLAASPKAVTQLAIASSYVVWRIFAKPELAARSGRRILILQALLLESLFLVAAEQTVPRVVVMLVAWAAGFVPAWLWLTAREEGLPELLASVWGLIVAECSFVFLTWQISYVTPGSYLIVPQAALVLSGLGYVFGGIYLSQRSGRLGRGRLAEYLLVLTALLVVVVAGTPWHPGT